MDKIIPFEKLKVTTMTYISNLNTILNLEMLFFLLSSYKEKGKKDITKGDIIFYGYRDTKKGEKKDIKLFKNAITISMFVEKEIIIKIFPKGTIHICGSGKEEELNETLEILREKIFSLNAFLKKIISIKDKKEKVSEIERFLRKKIVNNEEEIFIRRKKILEYNDIEIFKTKDLFYVSKRVVMRNYNFSLGFKIRKQNLHAEINKLSKETGFFSFFDPCINYFVRIVFYITNDNNEIECQKFLIFTSGSVTHIGKNRDVMEYGYYKFRELIEMLKEKIILE